MLNAFIGWSLARPWFVLVAAASLFLFGAWYIRTLPLEVFPTVTSAELVVQTEANGLVAEQVEQLVTRPIEAALLGAPGVSAIRSDSIPGLSVITLNLARGGDAARIRQTVAERLAQTAGALPSGVAAPKIAPQTSAIGDIVQVGFTSDRLDAMALRDLVQWTVRPRLLATAGVANVAVYGGRTRRIEVRARPGDLSDSDLGFADVLDAVRRATSVAGAGFMDTPEQRILIDPRGQALTTDDVAAGQIQVVGNAPVRISDVADVVDAPAPATGDALIMGRPGVLLSVTSQYGAPTLQTTRAVQAALATLTGALNAQGVTVSVAPDSPANSIAGATRGMIFGLLVAAVLVALILLAAFGEPRAVLAVALAIAPSLMAALVVVKALGLTLNIMTLGGLFIAAAIVIDDAVIDVESIVTRLRLAEAYPVSRSEAIMAALLEVRAPVIYATLLIDIALTPMLFLGGVFGPFLAPLALTTIVASLTSLAVSLCLTPASALLLLRGLQPKPEQGMVLRLKAVYARWIRRRCEEPNWALLALACALIATAVIVPLARRTAVPTFHDGRLILHFDAPASTSLEAMDRIGAGLTRAALTVPGVQRATERIGRDLTDFSAAGTEQSDIELDLDPALGPDAQDRAQARLRQTLTGYPDIQPRIRPGLGLSQPRPEDQASFTVAVYGDDLTKVDAAAAQLADGLRATTGARDVAIQAGPRAPSMRIDLNFKRLAIYGLSAADVLETVQTAFSGKTVAQVYQNGRAIDLAVAGPEDLRRDPEAMGELLLRSSSAVSVPLKTVANVYLTEGRTLIQHEAGLRRQVVTANPAPEDARRFGIAAERLIKTFVPPPGVFLSASDASAAAAADRRSLLVESAVAAMAMIALLLLIFRDGRMAALILLSTLFALFGGAVALLVTGDVLSLGAMAGFVALFGLSVRSAILLVSRPGDVAAARKADWTLSIVEESAVERAPPIILTGLLVVVVTLPLALGGGQVGSEILAPMAAVILGGLVSGVILTLLFLPGLVHGYLCPAHRHGLLPFGSRFHHHE